MRWDWSSFLKLDNGGSWTLLELELNATPRLHYLEIAETRGAGRVSMEFLPCERNRVDDLTFKYHIQQNYSLNWVLAKAEARSNLLSKLAVFSK